MTVLEIIMVIVGIGAVIISFKVSDNTGNTAVSTEGLSEAGIENISKEAKKACESFSKDISEKAEEAINSADEKLSTLSNEKIMGLSEYSDQILDKMEKNHSETVFLYDMLNEKEKEVKDLVRDIDVMKADIRDELVKEYQELKAKIEETDNAKKELELELLRIENKSKKLKETGNSNSTGNIYATKSENEVNNTSDNVFEDTAKVSGKSDVAAADTDFAGFDAPDGIDLADALDTDFLNELGIPNDDMIEDALNIYDSVSSGVSGTDVSSSDVSDSGHTSVYDAEIARIELEEQNDKLEQELYGSSEEDVHETVSGVESEVINHNDEIISLYKRGHSILEISKMLGIGQGEVKFVIDMFEA